MIQYALLYALDRDLSVEDAEAIGRCVCAEVSLCFDMLVSRWNARLLGTPLRQLITRSTEVLCMVHYGAGGNRLHDEVISLPVASKHSKAA